jgi:hypothetical protein
MESLTEAVLRYQDTGENYEKLIERISLLIYNYPDRVNNLSEEDKCDFYLGFYNRIKGLVSNFNYNGRPFEALLNQTLKWHSRTYLADRKKEKHLQAVEIMDEEIRINEMLQAQWSRNEIESAKVKIENSSLKQRLLFLVLMNSIHINEKEIEIFSEISGYDYNWLLEKRDTVLLELHNKSSRLNSLREKRNNYFTLLRYYQLQEQEEMDVLRKQAFREKIRKLRKRLEDTRRDISRIPTGPTHIQIAELLGVPKGTVDSGIHYFRKKFKNSDERSYSLIL